MLGVQGHCPCCGRSATQCPLFLEAYKHITKQLVGQATDKKFNSYCSHMHIGAPWSVASVTYRAIQDAHMAQAGTQRFSEADVVEAFLAVKAEVLQELYQRSGVEPSLASFFAADDKKSDSLLDKAEDRLIQYGVSADALLPSYFKATADVGVFNNAANAVASTVVNVYPMAFLAPGHPGMSGQPGAPLGCNHDQFAASSSQNQAGPSNHGGDAGRMNHPRHGSPSRHVSKPASVQTPAPVAAVKPQKSSAPQAAVLRQSTHDGVSAPAEFLKRFLSKVDRNWVFRLYDTVFKRPRGARLGMAAAFNEVWDHKQHDLKAVLSAQSNPDLEILHQKLYQVRHSHGSRRKDDLVQHIVEWFDRND